jgi:hypothetical protein
MHATSLHKSPIETASGLIAMGCTLSHVLHVMFLPNLIIVLSLSMTLQEILGRELRPLNLGVQPIIL